MTAAVFDCRAKVLNATVPFGSTFLFPVQWEDQKDQRYWRFWRGEIERIWTQGTVSVGVGRLQGSEEEQGEI